MRHLRHVASPDEVRITREPDGETAMIEYAADNNGATHFKIGPALKGMTWVVDCLPGTASLVGLRTESTET